MAKNKFEVKNMPEAPLYMKLEAVFPSIPIKERLQIISSHDEAHLRILASFDTLAVFKGLRDAKHGDYIMRILIAAHNAEKFGDAREIAELAESRLKQLLPNPELKPEYIGRWRKVAEDPKGFIAALRALRDAYNRHKRQ